MFKIIHLFARPCMQQSRTLRKPAIRYASQLYPTTSRRWDDAMAQAESIVGDANNLSKLQQWMSGEFTNITKYLQRLVGTNHPMLETAKRCAYISEGRMGSAQARGLTVILTAKAIDSLIEHLKLDKQPEEITKNQISLAEMTEMTYSAYMIHRGVMDLKMHGLEAVDFSVNQAIGARESRSRSEASADLWAVDPQQEKALHYGNKVSILCGDFLLAYVMRGLGELFSSKVVDLVASAITDFMEGEFLLIDDWRSQNYLLSQNSRDFSRWLHRSQATIGSLQGNTCQASVILANINGKLQLDARELGKNIGLAWQAHTELQPFLSDTYEPIELPEMPPYPSFDLNCLPVLLFLRESHKANKNFRLMINEIKSAYGKHDQLKGGKPIWQTREASMSPLIHQHRHQEPVDYKRLHEFILDDANAINETYKIIRGYSEKAIRHLESFPPSQSKEVLMNICESLYRK